jgi:hypothetical protein
MECPFTGPRRSPALRALFAAAALLASPAAVSAQDAPAAPPPPDYADAALWLCRPGIEVNRCEVDLDATVVAADGTLTLERFRPAQDPKVDCFYIYPTVSTDPGHQSDFSVDPAEINVVALQFARFREVCRTFAPLYRQTTLRRLRVAMGGPPPEGDPPAEGVGGYADVRAAWRWYMDHENDGRGVVLIGHSQGGVMINRLIAEEIDGKPAQAQLVSAYILGAPVMVPDGADVGGSFKTVPVCRAADQAGCVVSYASFRDIHPPPPVSRFGFARDGMRAVCVNPANLSGEPGEPKSYFMTHGSLNGSSGTVQPEWTQPPRPIGTRFVTTPGLVTTRCVREGPYDYLSMHVNADPADARTDEVFGEIIRAAGPDYAWGLHNIDVDHSMGTLIDLVRRQSAAYAEAGQ